MSFAGGDRPATTEARVPSQPEPFEQRVARIERELADVKSQLEVVKALVGYDFIEFNG